MEIRMGRILKFNTDKANELIRGIEDSMAEVLENLQNLIPFTIAWYEHFRTKYSKGRTRKTEIRSFENIEASKVIVANEKLYIDREEGFIGTGLKKAEFLCDCSDIDDIIVFRRDGVYFVIKVTDKAFIGKNPLHVAIFEKNDNRTIYNLVYRDGKAGATYMKRFSVTGVTRDKEYNMTMGTEGSRILYFSANPNGESEVLRITFKPKPKLKKLVDEIDIAQLAIKGRQSMGNLVTKNEVHKVTLKEKGLSTLGGRKIWFDEDVLRLNADGRGKYLGEFTGDEKILVLDKDGGYQVYSYDLENHFEKNLLSIEKFRPEKVASVVYFDTEQKFYYVKRFQIEINGGKPCRFIGDDPNNKLVSVTWVTYPRLEIEFGGEKNSRENEIVEVAEFIGVKSYKAKGKRLSSYEVKDIHELEPIIKDEELKPEEILPPIIDDVPFEIIRATPPPDLDPSQMEIKFE